MDDNQKFNREMENILLSFCPPNNYGKSVYFKIQNGNFVEVTDADAMLALAEQPERLCGWALYVRTWKFEKQYLAMFLYEDVIWMFVDGKYFPVKRHSFFWTRHWFFWKMAIFFEDVAKYETRVVARVKFITPITRHLANDGAFPESIEPLQELLDGLKTRDGYMDTVEFLRIMGDKIFTLSLKRSL